MKTEIKLVGGLALFSIVMACLLHILVKDFSENLKLEEEKYKKHIGKKHIVDRDTLTVIDYSILSETFTLSDGRRINYALIGEDYEWH